MADVVHKTCSCLEMDVRGVVGGDHWFVRISLLNEIDVGIR